MSLLEAILTHDRAEIERRARLATGTVAQDCYAWLLDGCAARSLLCGVPVTANMDASIKAVLEHPPTDKELYCCLLPRLINRELTMNRMDNARRLLGLWQSMASLFQPAMTAYTLIVEGYMAALDGSREERFRLFERALDVLADDGGSPVWCVFASRLAWCATTVYRFDATRKLLPRLERQEAGFDANGCPLVVPCRLIRCDLNHYNGAYEAVDRETKEMAACDALWDNAYFCRIVFNALIKSGCMAEGERWVERIERRVPSTSGKGDAPVMRGFLLLCRRQYDEACHVLHARWNDGLTTPRTETGLYLLELAAHLELCRRNPDAADVVLRALDPRKEQTAYAGLWTRRHLLRGDTASAQATFSRLRHRAGDDAVLGSLALAHELDVAQLAALWSRARPDSHPPPSLPTATEEDASSACELIGSSPVMREVRRHIELFAPHHHIPVLLTGETGTGKEIAVRRLHALGCHPDAPFVPINCACLNDALLESELFGHRKGAFTGATGDRIGLLQSAGCGTVMLDEIQSMSPHMQAALLRTLESGEIRPVGGHQTACLKARVVAAANQDIEALAAQGSFRPDLYYRLNRFHIHLPPLREHIEDIEELIRFFLRTVFRAHARSIPDDLIRRYATQSWKGNVRELRNAVERFVILGDDRCGPPQSDPSLQRTGVLRSSDIRPWDVASYGNPANRHNRRLCLCRLFEEHGRLTRAQVIALLSCAPNTATRDLNMLVEEGMIRRINPTPHPRTAYFVWVPR